MTDKNSIVVEFNRTIRAMLKYMVEEFKSDANISAESQSALNRLHLVSKASDSYLITLLEPLFVDLAPLIVKADFNSFCNTPTKQLFANYKLSSSEVKFISLLQTALVKCDEDKLREIHKFMTTIVRLCISHKLL